MRFSHRCPKWAWVRHEVWPREKNTSRSQWRRRLVWSAAAASGNKSACELRECLEKMCSNLVEYFRASSERENKHTHCILLLHLNSLCVTGLTHIKLKKYIFSYIMWLKIVKCCVFICKYVHICIEWGSYVELYLSIYLSTFSNITAAGNILFIDR